MTTFSKALKILSLTKDDMSEIQSLCEWENKEEFSDSEMEMLTEIIQRKTDGAGSYAVAYEQMQVEEAPIEPEPVESQPVEPEPKLVESESVQKSDNTDNILDRAEKIADHDGTNVLHALDGYGDDLQKAVLGAYMNRLNRVFENAHVQRAVIEKPDDLAKKPGPFTSRLRERLAGQANQTALPAASTNSSTETLPTE